MPPEWEFVGLVHFPRMSGEQITVDFLQAQARPPRPLFLQAPTRPPRPLRCAPMVWTKMADSEVKLARRWFVEDGESTGEIARRLGRDRSTVTRLLVKRLPRKVQGRKRVLTPAAVDKLEKKLATMIEKADGWYPVTVSMLKRSSRSPACTRTILDALHKRGVYFRPQREKPVLTEQDIADRLAFANRFAAKSAAWWSDTIHMIIDVKHFQVLPHGAARRHTAQQAVRGTYRKKGQGLHTGHTKPSSKSKFNTGAGSLAWYSRAYLRSIRAS